MLRITCPYCGPRDEVEFRYGGEAHIAYPEDPSLLDEQTWGDYLFMRGNPKGWFRERWMHVHGCRRWFNALRHTVTHRVATTYKMGERAELPSEPDAAAPRIGI